jgi:hypothetical protein
MAEPVRGREGARWINERPTAEEFGEWFGKNVKLDPALEPEDYVGGIVLIPAVEKARIVSGYNQQSGGAIIDEREQLVFVPYGKVETRIAYYWDLLAAHPDWVGEITYVQTTRPSVEPIATKEQVLHGEQMIDRETSRVPAVAQIVEQLPDGFFLMSVPVGTSFTHFLCCTIEITIKDDTGKLLRKGRGTKMVALTRSGRSADRVWADENSIMKAETGALGRALGVAGVFVIPGSGVATAEDMLELNQAPAAAQEQAPATEAATPPPVEREASQVTTSVEVAQDERTKLVTHARELLQVATEEYPDVIEKFREWGAQRKPRVRDLNALGDPELKGAIKRLEKLVDEAKQSAQQAPEPEATPDAEPSGS